MSDRSEERSDGKSASDNPVTKSSPVWLTLVVGLVMLLVGLAAGYFGRPLITPEEIEPEVAAESPSSADRQEMMDFLIEETRHFRGDPDAVVTIIEFSDFQ